MAEQFSGTPESTIANVAAALQAARTIGIAIGILMERHGISADEAFARLMEVSRRTARKVSHIAADLVDGGELPWS